ncbi:hypothetical protein BGX28_009180 [Mortierella sp. GBA30]|nr:hypothetical protein BGX28_009180 [Mortierella sp. GBA30]
MVPTTIHSVVKIPELAALISQYFSPCQIAKCMRVCKAWLFYFRPYFWTNFQAGRTLPHNRALVQRNLHRIRTIEITHKTDKFLEFLAGSRKASISARPTRASTQEQRLSLCNNVRRIKTGHRQPWDNLRPAPYLLTLLHRNLSLTHLTLPAVTVGSDKAISREYLEAISHLLKLRHLNIRADNVNQHCVDQHCVFSILRTALLLPELSALYCDFFVNYNSDASESDVEAMLSEVIAVRTSEGTLGNKLEVLKLPDASCGKTNTLLAPFLKSKLLDLTSFECPCATGGMTRDAREKIAKEHCPNLRRLMYQSGDDEEHSFIMDALIAGSSGLQFLQAEGYSDELMFIHSKFVGTVSFLHSETIEEIELLDCYMVHNDDLRKIFSKCKRLRRFWLEPELEGRVGIEFQDIIDNEWVCLGLRELSLSLNRNVYVREALQAMRKESSSDRTDVGQSGDDVGSVDSEDEGRRHLFYQNKRKAQTWAAKRVYAQIGRLVMLEVLSLGVHNTENNYCEVPGGWGMTDCKAEDVRRFEWDLTLSKGWLQELARLKNLRHLHMRIDFWSRMGQAEVEFMDREWPLLDEIRFGGISTGCYPLTSLLKEPHWQWLKKKRPSLRYSFWSKWLAKNPYADPYILR